MISAFTSPRRVARIGGLAGALSASILSGQVVPEPAAQRAAALEEAVQLSPFVLSTERDTGWSANDTLSANRTKQALKDVPVNIDAITADFIQDLGLFSADDVAGYVANVYAAPVMENDNATLKRFLGELGLTDKK